MTTEYLDNLNGRSKRAENIHAGISVIGGWCRKAEKATDPDEAIEYLHKAKHRLSNILIADGLLKRDKPNLETGD